MPSATDNRHDIDAVAAFGSFLDDLLSRAESVKQTASLEPPLDKSDFEDIRAQLSQILGHDDSLADETVDVKMDNADTKQEAVDPKRTQRFAILETAVRDTFSNLIATTPIDSPAFVKVWNLFDILAIFSDAEQCEPGLLFWLVEELLDSQTIAGCRKVFDYLESRRERITTKHFKAKKLVILRTCNDLLRRLSRTLDPAFCGRVFIFMFQCFPLGDKSSVNLRGEYHVENVTTFDARPANTDAGADKMDVDADEKGKKQQEKDKTLDPDDLYPIFWPLQESFNQPKKLFDPSHFAAFKAGLESTLEVFKAIDPEQRSRSREKSDRHIEENGESLKRKRSYEDDELAGAFNPKYLTSRDLFKLEISDVAFRRNILVQALIVMDFLLGLSPAAKEKLSSILIPNKSVMYSDHKLSDEDTEWAMKTKQEVETQLKKGSLEANYFHRVVDTVVRRDKNWVRWKIENCPSIERPAVTAEDFVEARRTAGKLAATKRVRATPMGSLPLDFLDDGNEAVAMEQFKATDRYALPELTSFKRGIADDDFEIEMPTNNETKAAAIEGKASKSWRALRIASKYKLAVFDGIESDEKIDAIFEENVAQESDDATEQPGDDAVFPQDRRPIIIVDASDHTGRHVSQLTSELLTKHPGVLTKVLPHVTRKPEEGESRGDSNFVETQAFNMMRDGDQLLAFTEGDNCWGVSRRAIESITDSGKVAIAVMDRDAVQQVKDFEFSARCIFIQPPASEILKSQLEESGLGDEKTKEALKVASELSEYAATSGFYDAVVSSDLKALEFAVFGTSLNGTTTTEAATGDVTMQDAEPKAA
ncbi:THO complex subunit 1 transcription elongation factor-domain-containing protein [Cercophora newfieldiana]|uniref:THO complex subunit 1 transcription elongation factor-domain-containing protein n=1 Tax=Cercophora newfieldiana TaxID=92897 RepID=A0AA39Y6V9_9PEZI|nr:THO complex subunit 1 transcription elongation factor-domain-containing protein [Cercophora newfieldiana]